MRILHKFILQDILPVHIVIHVPPFTPQIFGNCSLQLKNQRFSKELCFFIESHCAIVTDCLISVTWWKQKATGPVLNHLRISFVLDSCRRGLRINLLITRLISCHCLGMYTSRNMFCLLCFVAS